VPVKGRLGRVATGAGATGTTSTLRAAALPPPLVGQLWKLKLPGMTVSGTTRAATSTTAGGTLAMKALAILICRLYRHL
jgi:hypothetical protein